MPEPPSISLSPVHAGDECAAKPSCLLLHGLGGGPHELGPLHAALLAEGLEVAAPVLPGHEPHGPVMPSSSWRDWAATALEAFDDLADRGQPVVVLGFSTGATLALYLSSLRPASRLVLMAPFLAIRYSGFLPFSPSCYLRQVARLIPNLPRRPPAVRDPEMRRQAAASEHFRTFSLAATLSALELIDIVKTLVPSIRVPVLIIQGLRDTVVEPALADWLCAHIGSTQKELIKLARSDHLVALDHEREQVIVRVRDFVLARDRSAGKPNDG